MPSSAKLISDAELHRQAVSPDALALISASDAWDQMLLPLRQEGGKLLAATTLAALASSRRLLAERGVAEVDFLLCDPVPLEQCIACYYDFEGLTGAA